MGDDDVRLLGFYAARGWDISALNRAADWTPAERTFFDIARKQYWDELAELLNLVAGRMMSALAEQDYSRQLQEDWKSWYKRQTGKELVNRGNESN